MSQRVNSDESRFRMSRRRRIRHPALRHYSEEELEDMIIGPAPSLDRVNPAGRNVPAVSNRRGMSRTVRRYTVELVADRIAGRRLSSNPHRDRQLRSSRRPGMWRTVSDDIDEQLRDRIARPGMWRTVSDDIDEQLRDRIARPAVNRNRNPNPNRNQTEDEGENDMAIVEEEIEWMVPAAERAIEALESQKVVIDGDDVEERECVICLESFERESELCRLGCSHVFHGDCLRTWLKKSHYCPLCRFQLPAQSSD